MGWFRRRIISDRPTFQLAPTDCWGVFLFISRGLANQRSFSAGEKTAADIVFQYRPAWVGYLKKEAISSDYIERIAGLVAPLVIKRKIIFDTGLTHDAK